MAISSEGSAPVRAGDGSGAVHEWWKIEAANHYGVRTYTGTDSSGRHRYGHESQLPDWAVAALGPTWLADFAKPTGVHWTWTVSGAEKDDVALSAIAESHRRSWQALDHVPDDSRMIQSLRTAWRAPLEQRAALVAETATYAVRLLDSLQKEIAARSAVVQALAGEADAAQERAQQAAQLAKLNEEQAAAVNAFLDRLLEARLDSLERKARRREWMLATIVALVIGGCRDPCVPLPRRVLRCPVR